MRMWAVLGCCSPESSLLLTEGGRRVSFDGGVEAESAAESILYNERERKSTKGGGSARK